LKLKAILLQGFHQPGYASTIHRHCLHGKTAFS